MRMTRFAEDETTVVNKIESKKMILKDLIALLSTHDLSASVSINGDVFHSLIIRQRDDAREGDGGRETAWIDIRTVGGTDA